ncbi:MAG TPA: AraC family transcriptional regulator [Flavitalea sp.]|nr:AraC family transcriptional regulator [Flavitalea sp.]
MEHGFRLPHDSVKEYVDGILVMENFRIDNPFTLPLFANGCPTLLFQTKKACLNQQSAGHFTLFGQTIKPGALILNETFTLIAYFFKPHSLISLFNVAGNELSDSYVDLHLLMQRESNELEEKLLNCTTADKMVLILDNYILNLIDKKRKDTQRIAFATTLIKENLQCDNLKSVQDNLCVTEKTLHRMFESNLGVSPRLYKRICRFNAAFQQLNSRKFLKLTDIVYDNGYADQSHFIRTFKEFTNITPTDYLNLAEISPD